MKMSSSRFTPLFFAIFLVLGIGIGTFYANHFSGNRLGIISGSSDKLNALLRVIDEQYVDTVDLKELVEATLPQILSDLDPHSSYLPPTALESANDELKGSFGGVGIQFSILNDTARVNSVVESGPSDNSGIVPGDRIITVDDSLMVGKALKNSMNIVKRLKGEIGTKVKIGILHQGEKEIEYYTITRGSVPVKSVEAVYMIDNKYGYIRVDKFGENTYPEFLMALATLNQANCKGIIVDLRSNTGGYMSAAIQMVNEFLPKNQLIVYTQGRKMPRQDYRSNGTGSNQNIPLVVIVNEESASASEIFTGAIQDNDRGTIVGRRSFGKGLVQQPIDFSDGSGIRITVARYYTPSGRCIQKPYIKGASEDYERDLLQRYQHGEFFSQDSIKQDEKEKYRTRIGRTVYGGGGIMPDFFVPEDSVGTTPYLREAYRTGLLIRFSYDYIDKHRSQLKTFDTSAKLNAHLIKQGLVQQFAVWAEGKGLKRRNRQISASYKLIETHLISSMIESLFGRNAFYEYINKTDNTVLKAVDILKEGKAFPTVEEATTTPPKA